MSNLYSNALREIKQKLLQESLNPSLKSKLKFSLTDPKNIEFRKKYIGTNYDFFGLSVPQEQSVYKEGFDFLKELNFEEKLKLWTFIWSESRHYHVMSQAVKALSELIKEIDSSQKHRLFLKILKSWLPHLDNWAHSDGLSSLLAELLELSLRSSKKDTVLVKEHIKLRLKWNKSKNFWERRQSVVSLLYYSTLREKILPFKILISFVDPLLEDEAFYVQRGVGWTLRELYNCYPKETSQYLRKNIKKLSSIAFSASTEKISKKEKSYLLKLRKNKPS